VLISFFFIAEMKPEINNLKEKGFILAHSLSDFSPWSLGCIVRGL
jgi:hypothetical protein